MIIGSVTVTMFIGMIPMAIERTNMKSAARIIVLPGALNFVQEAMFIKR
jgi:hypothetical protein